VVSVSIGATSRRFRTALLFYLSRWPEDIVFARPDDHDVITIGPGPPALQCGTSTHFVRLQRLPKMTAAGMLAADGEMS
jgi:hypothetical protein